VSTQQLTVGALLVFLQLLILRAAQHAVPSLYFTTSSLFDQRADVSGAALLFRLSLPLGAGVAAALALTDGEWEVAAAAGACAWFLVIWPIVWNPRLVEHAIEAPFVLLLAAFWVAFAILPLVGVALVGVVENVLGSPDSDWDGQYVWAVVTGVPIALMINVAGRLARSRLSFADDPVDHAEDDDEDEPRGWRARVDRDRFSELPPWAPWAVAAVSVLLLLRGRSRA